MSSSEPITLPVVDFGNAVGVGVGRQQETSKLIDAFTDVGFATVVNVDGYDEEELFKWIKWFYSEVTPEVTNQVFACGHWPKTIEIL